MATVMTNYSLPFPWQAQTWQQLSLRCENKNLPHALLIKGAIGVGKAIFARHFSHYRLCEQPHRDAPCLQCASCHWFAVGSHPDYFLVEPTGKTQIIKIDQIRDLCVALQLTSHGGGNKVGLILQAERMNINAANSFLKSLEEPTGNTLFILVSAQPGLLPATIRSRCQSITIPMPEKSVAMEWLHTVKADADEQVLLAARGAPLLALDMLETGTLSLRHERFGEFSAFLSGRGYLNELISRWQKMALAPLLSWLHSWVRDLIRLQITSTSADLENPDLRQGLEGLNKNLSLTLLFTCDAQLGVANRYQHSSVNPQLLLESIMVLFRGCSTTADKATLET